VLPGRQIAIKDEVHIAAIEMVVYSTHEVDDVVLNASTGWPVNTPQQSTTIDYDSTREFGETR